MSSTHGRLDQRISANLIESNIGVFVFFLGAQDFTQISRIFLVFQLADAHPMPGLSFALDDSHISVVSQPA